MEMEISNEWESLTNVNFHTRVEIEKDQKETVFKDYFTRAVKIIMFPSGNHFHSHHQLHLNKSEGQ